MNAIQSPTQSHALCACDDPAFKAQIAGLQAMTATLNNSARHCEADSIYQNYCFGDGVQVAGQDGWEYTTPGDVWLFFWQSEANNLGVGLFTTALCR